MSDDGDMGAATSDDQDLIIDKELDAVVRQFIETYAFEKRRVYFGLIKAAQLIRGGHPLDDID